MKQLAIRGIPDELENIIRKEAAEKKGGGIFKKN